MSAICTVMDIIGALAKHLCTIFHAIMLTKSGYKRETFSKQIILVGISAQLEHHQIKRFRRFEADFLKFKIR